MKLTKSGAVTASTTAAEIEVSFSYLYVKNTGSVDLYINPDVTPASSLRHTIASGAERYIPVSGDSFFHSCASSTCTFIYEAFKR